MQIRRKQRTTRTACLLVLAASLMTWIGGAGSASSAQTAGNKQIQIVVDSKNPGASISPLLYGTNVFWIPGMNGLQNRLASEVQYRQAIAKWYGYLPIISELGPTILRFPGGLSSNFYIWNRAIGPFPKRKRMNDRPGAVDPIIGTDEFLLLCEELGAEAMITVNMNRASGATPIKMLLNADSLYRDNAAIAADWVEYCNAPNDGSNPRGGVDWAAERARNGHAAPYGVKYWELGNELQDMPAGMYEKAVGIFSQAMKSVDPTIRIGALTPLRDWQAKKSNEWFQQVGGKQSNRFDFWIRHTYMPSTSGKIRGFILTGKGASISAPLQLPGADEYEIRLRAMTQRGNADLTLSIPETGAKSVCSVGPREKECSLKASLKDKACTLRLELTRGAHVLPYHVAEWTGRRTGQGYIDLKNSPELYELTEAGPLVADQRWFSPDKIRGKPVCVTEYNSAYETYGSRGQTRFVGQVYSLRDAMNVGMFLQTFIRGRVEAATQWLLFGDQECFGLIEGVGVDALHGGERGRPNPHPRPSYYMIKLFRDHMTGQTLPVDIRSPTYHIGPPPPYEAMGYVGHQPLDVAFLQGTAAIDADGRRLSLIVQNLSEADPLTASIDLRGFSPANKGERYTLNGEFAWATNEPETCPKGGCVDIEKSDFPVSGSRFTYTFPAHSATALVFYKEDARRQEVGPPQNLRGTVTGSRVQLTWKPPQGVSPAGYHLYRSRFASGPFRNRIQTLSASKNEASDTVLDTGEYTYGVRAFNALGEEGPFSNSVKLQYAGKK